MERKRTLIALAVMLAVIVLWILWLTLGGEGEPDITPTLIISATPSDTPVVVAAKTRTGTATSTAVIVSPPSATGTAVATLTATASPTPFTGERNTLTPTPFTGERNTPTATPTPFTGERSTPTATWPAPYRVESGDHLWGIAERFYENGRCWAWIYKQNRGTVEDANLIYRGERLWFERGGCV